MALPVVKEDVLDRLEFMRLAPQRVLVVGDWTGTLALSLAGNGAVVEERDVASLDEEQPIAGGPFNLLVSLASLDRVNDQIHDLVIAYEGSVAAEHGVGQLKRDLMARTKDPVELELMRTLKRALDPNGIMNPKNVVKVDY